MKKCRVCLKKESETKIAPNRLICQACRGTQWRQNNPEGSKALSRHCHYGAMNDPKKKEHYNARMREYRLKRKLSGNPVLRKTTAVEEGRLYKWDRDKLHALVFEKKGKLCFYCGSEADTVDHMIPLCSGGTHAMMNLVPACRGCNSSKRDKSFQEWIAHLRKNQSGLLDRIERSQRKEG